MGRNFGFFPFLIRMYWIYFISLGWLLTLLILVPALIKKRKYDEAYLKELQALEEERILHLQKLTEETLDCEKQKINLQSYVDNLNTDIDQKHERLVEMRSEETTLRNTLATLAETEERVRSNMETAIEQRSEMLSSEYKDTEMAFIEEYTAIRQQAVDEFQKAIKEKKKELCSIDALISDKQAIYQAILEDEQRKAKEEAERDFYRLNIPKEDLEEVERIRDITPYLRNPEVLNKVLWTSYYQKPYQDLIARQFKDKKPSGIYKITCLPDGKIYIGQSVNVPNRFSEHIKRGLGAEPATRNRLYPAMKKWGVENFIFELLEEVPREKLDERERYWIEYFHSAEIGLNGNKGVKG